MLPPSVFAEEPTDELTQETIDRVYDEVLSGEITSTEDVLRVALAQYEARQTATYGMRSRGNNTESEDEVPRIIQIIESTQDENGYYIFMVADTGILATDSEGQSIVSENLGNQIAENFSEINIVAYHTVYYTYRHEELPPFIPTNEVKIYKQSTKLIANGSTLPTKLVHQYWSPLEGINQCNYSKTFSYPSTNTTYSSYPSGEHVDWESISRPVKPGFGSIALIYYGSAVYDVSIDINASAVEGARITW